MISLLNYKKFASAVALVCVGFISHATSAFAENDLRKELDQALNNMETVHFILQELGHTKDVGEALAQLDSARTALENTPEEVWAQASQNADYMDALLEIDEMVLEAISELEIQSARKAAGKTNPILQSATLTVPSTQLTDVDTEELVLEGCLDQLAMQASTTALRIVFFSADAAAEIVGPNVVVAGTSAPNPLKVTLVAVEFAAKAALFALDESIKLNALCLLRNERKIAREYIQARQVRFTPHKTIEAKFDVVKPKQRGRDGWRYTFWMHLTKDGKPTNAEVTRILASRLRDANDNFVELNDSQINITQSGVGLYKLVLDTPVNHNIDYVRGFIVHLESTQTSPGGSDYTHYGVGHIRSDVNSRDF